MSTPVPAERYKNHRFPPEVISGIWMRSFSRFVVSGTISDGRSIRMAMSSRSLAQRRRDKKAAKKFTSNTLLEAARAVWLYEKGWDASHCRFHHVSTMRSTARWNPTIHLSARRCRVRRAKPPQITLYGRTTRPSAPPQHEPWLALGRGSPAGEGGVGFSTFREYAIRRRVGPGPSPLRHPPAAR
jgi:hypothetical protein